MSSPSEPPFPFTDAPADLTLASSSAPGLAEPAWLAIRAFKVYTLIYVLPEPGAVDAEPRVLLGLKQRGAFTGIWNGFGGKVELSDESVAAAALRELEEEAGIRATDLRYRGRVVFGPGEVNADVSIDIWLFSCATWEGEIAASEEMGLPAWFLAQLPTVAVEYVVSGSLPALPPLPTAAMHNDALLYLPHLFVGRSILARFDYARPKVGVESGSTETRGLQRWWIGKLTDGASSGIGGAEQESRPTG